MVEPLRVLIVEDSEDDTRLLARELERAGYDVSSKRVETAEEMKAALEKESWDFVISDYSLPAFNAPAALRMLQTSGLDLPFIIVSGTVGEDVAVECMRAGAHDFFLKENLTRLAPAVRRELEQAEQRQGRRQAEEGMRRSEERFRKLFDSHTIGIVIADLAGRTLEANDAYLDMLGYSREELLAGEIRWDELTPPEYLERDKKAVEELQRTGVASSWEKELLRKDGKRVPVLMGVAMLPASEGACIAYIVDLSSQKVLEERLRLSQKMEAVGRLAGGVAHDFNNLLTAILGYGSLLSSRLAPGAPGREELDEMLRASERATALTQQLLAFSRKQVLEPVVLDVNELVRNLEKMLRRLIGEDLELATKLDALAGRVRADHGQLEQVIMNLVLNARDAMPNGGRLTIETANADLDESYAQRHITVRPGRYVMVAVSDTGTGMDAETQAHIFEPFFTTKEKGKGTGLGLSTVYGIVKQSGGNIWVYSEPGKGTTFKVYLPRVGEPAEEGVPRTAGPLSTSGTGTILVVEDEPAIRALAKRVLEGRGYRVIEAGSGKDALERVRAEEGPINLLLTDLVMPDMPGTELACRLEEMRPGVRVLFMSGYTDDGVVRSGQLGSGHAFLQKPFTPGILASKVREILS